MSLFIYLGLLQLATVIGIHHLPFSENVQASNTCFTVTVAGAASATKGELDFGTCRARIDIENACSDITHGPLYAIDILGINGTREAISGIVVYRNGFIEGANFDDR